MNFVKGYVRSLFDPELVPTALKVAASVGTILFLINHGSAVLNGRMSRDRWSAAGVTYIVPYMVNIHGQYTSRQRIQKQQVCR